jgi:large subunit ribosomal protein L10
MRLASKGTDLEKLHAYFEGPTAIALSYGDPVPLAKIITEFQKTVPALEIKIGLADGRVTSPAEVKAMASMPSREVLFAQILGGVQVPGNQLGGAIVNAIQQLLGVLQARVDQLANSSVEGGV